jgi:hypothetical protein
MSNNTVNEMKSGLGKTPYVCFSMDTTGSMRPCIRDVLQKIRDLVEQLSQDIPGVKIGLIAHGDYGDGPNAIRSLDLTDNMTQIMEFLQNAPMTSGGDLPECYELALNRASTMSWPAEGGALVLIGDDQPHEPTYPGNTDHLDWKIELENLKAKNVKVFALQCLKAPSRFQENAFWESVSQSGNTPLLLLDNFEESARTLGAVTAAMSSKAAFDAYRSKDVATYGDASISYNESLNKLSDFAAEDEK